MDTVSQNPFPSGPDPCFRFNDPHLDFFESFESLIRNLQRLLKKGTPLISDVDYNQLSDASKLPHRSPFIADNFILPVLRDISEHHRRIGALKEGMLSGLRWLDGQTEELNRAKTIIEGIQRQSFQPFPPFPLDIGEYLIELAAAADRQTALTLVLVSKEVQVW